MTQLEPRLSYIFKNFPTPNEYTSTYTITDRGIKKCHFTDSLHIKSYTSGSHARSEEDVSRDSVESSESGYQSSSPRTSLKTCKTPDYSYTHPVHHGKRSPLRRKLGKVKISREGIGDVTYPKECVWNIRAWRRLTEMAEVELKEDVTPVEARNDLCLDSSLLRNVTGESFILSAYKNLMSISPDSPPVSPNDGRRATIFYEEEDVPECPPQVPTYVMEKSVIRHPQEIYLQVPSHKAIQSEPSLVCMRGDDDGFGSDESEDVSESEFESEEEESKSEEEESESEEDVLFGTKEEFASGRNKETREEGTKRKTEKEETSSESGLKEALKTLKKSDTSHSNTAEAREIRHMIKVLRQKLHEINRRDRQKMKEVLKSPTRTEGAPWDRERAEEVEVLELRNKTKVVTQNAAQSEHVTAETADGLEPRDTTKLEPMAKETEEDLDPRTKAKLMVQRVMKQKNNTNRMVEVPQPQISTPSFNKQELTSTGETADTSQPQNQASVVVSAVNKSEPLWKVSEASEPQRKDEGVGANVSNRLFERRGRSKDPLLKGMKKLRRLVRVYVTEDIDEPPFQYVPEVLPSSATIKGVVPPLQESLMLLGEGLEAGSLVAQFEQLYRRKPGLTVTEARRQENEKKNRYRDISPYDTTRVILTTSPSGDYINASYVNMEVQASGIVNRYIASQGPLAGTCADFWYMVWEQQSTLIVMLTTVVEQGRVKCHRYWPRLYETVDFGILQVTCNKEEETPGFAFREFTLINTETQEERHITHMQYLAWPDHGVPDDSTEFLNFVTQVRKARVGMVEPTIVHCSAGIGRTGVLILMETAQCLIEANEPIYPLDIVKAMRDQRAMMIQTASQFRFVCEAIHRVYTEELVKPLAEYEQR